MTYDSINEELLTLSAVIKDLGGYSSTRTLKRRLDKENIPTFKWSKTTWVKKSDLVKLFKIRLETTSIQQSEPIPKKIYKKPKSSTESIYEKKIKEKMYGS